MNLGAFQGQRETRHDIGHQRHARPEDIGADGVAVGLVGQRQHRVGVGVIDEFVRQEGVQQGLHRGVRRALVQQIGALDVDHVLVRKHFQVDQLADRLQPHGGQAGRFDIAEIPARALDAQHIHRLAHDVGGGGLYRRVAAAMQHQRRISAQQPRGIDAQRHIAVDALARVGRDHRLGVLIRPLAQHLFFSPFNRWPPSLFAPDKARRGRRGWRIRRRAR